MNDSLLQNALQLRRAGRLAEAAALYGELLRTDPKHFEALHALGLVRYQGGQLAEAEQLIGRAIAVNPRAADALYNRATLLQRLNRFEEALASYANAIAVKPDYLEAWTNRGVLLYRLGRLPEALADFDRVVALKPSFAEAWRNRGGLLASLGRLDEALASFDKSLRLNPQDADGLRQRADVLLALQRAKDAWQAYGAYLAVRPTDVQAWTHRGIAATELKRTEDALACFDKAAGLDPADADIWNNKANALFELKRFPEAAQDYERALKAAPDLPFVEGYLMQARLRSCDWSRLTEDRRRIAEGLRTGRQTVDPLSNLAISRGPGEQLQCARIWIAEGYPAVQPPLWRGEIYRHEKIRVAYLSADFRPHAVAFLIAGVLDQHDKTRVETIGVSLGAAGESDIRTRIARSFDSFIDGRDKTDAEIAATLRRMEVDIAIDLMGFTDGCRTGIFAFRPAPVQVNYLGYPGTMGADYMDYLLADRILIPESEHGSYAEKIVTLPDTYQANDSKRVIAERTPSRAEAGLPDKGVVFCCFNNGFKILPDTFDVWMRILRAVEGSVLWLLEDNAVVAGNLRREAQARGVAPERIVFAPRMEVSAHLARHRLADLFLDTLPYNAHTTGSDALWAGLPVVTCAGTAFAGRVASSLLHAAGLPELIVDSLDAYEALAVKLAHDPAMLAAIKTKLAANRANCALFDTARMTRHLEATYRTMRERQRNGEKPRAFDVPPTAAP